MSAVVLPNGEGFGWDCSSCGGSAGMGSGERSGPMVSTVLPSGEQLTGKELAERGASNHNSKICTKRSTR